MMNSRLPVQIQLLQKKICRYTKNTHGISIQINSFMIMPEIMCLIYKALKTERFRYTAYSWQYGIELKKFIGKVMTVGERISEFKRAIIECLMVNPYIKSINSITINREKTELNCEIDLTTIYGELVINV